MLPTTTNIVWQLAAMHDLYPKETISELAARLMFSPIFIINALDLAEQMELLQRKKDKKGGLTEILEAVVPFKWENLEGNEFGTDNKRVQDEILRAVASANVDENDVEDGTLQAWCRGLKPCEIELAITFLTRQNILADYELADPGDKKSVYTFHSLATNVSNQWGIKQFKAKKAKK
jgi:hypothetical protein